MCTGKKTSSRAGDKATVPLFKGSLKFLALPLLVMACLDAKTTSLADITDDLTQVSLEDLSNIKVNTVYGASKYVQKTKEAPSTVTIVEADEIQKYGHRTLADILRSVSGLYVGYDRNYSYLGIRGFNRPGDYNGRVLLLVDGHRFNDNIYDSALIGTEFPLDVDMIDRVEIVRGPSFSVFGNNAVFAVINVITKRGRDFHGAEISGEAGSSDTYKGRFSFGQKFKNDVELALSGSIYDSAGQERLYYPEYNTVSNNVNHGITERTDYDRYYNFIATLAYHDFSIQGLYGSREKGIPTGSFGTTFNDPRTRTIDNRAYAEAKYHHQFEPDWEVTTRLYYDHYHYDGDYLYEPVVNCDSAEGNWWGGELQVTRKLSDRHTLVAGAEFQHNFQQDQGNLDVEPRTVYFEDRRTSWNWAVYGQGDITILTNLILSAGVRYDHFDVFGDTVNPRVGLIGSLFPTTTLKLLYGTAFRSPNTYELYYAGYGTKPNPNLGPEEVTTYQAVFEQDLPHHLRFNATAYYYEIDGLISQETDINDPLDPDDDAIVFRNLQQVSAKGLELALEGTRASGLRGRVSYALQQTEDKATGGELSNSPRHLAKLNLIVPLYRDRLFSGLELQYVSTVRTLAGNQADDFWIANLTLFSQKLVQNLDLSAGIYNLFDEHYGNPGAGEHLQDVIAQDGRTFRVKLTYRF